MRRVNEVTGPARKLRFKTGGIRRVMHRTDSAMEVIGPLVPGDRVTGVTGGQFSAIDVLEHMVDELGPADVRVTAWTSGIYDAQRVRDLAANGRILSVRMIVDRGTFEKSPQYSGLLIEQLGVDAFRSAAIHSKVVVVSGRRGRAVLRTSMGFNKNTRTEQFDIDVDDEIEAFYRIWFDDLWAASGEQLTNSEIFKRVFDKYVDMGRPQATEWGRFEGEDAEVVSARIAKVQRQSGKRPKRGQSLEDLSMSQEEFLRMLGD